MDKQSEKIKQRYNRIAPVFNVMDHMVKSRWRKELLADVKGKVLEVGVGTGANMPFYPKNDVHIIGIDFSPKMLNYAKKRVYQEHINHIELMEMDVQTLEFEDNYFDYVVTSCVFCSVPDAIKGLQEIRRVIKPTGKVLMLEHMRSEQPVVGLMMDMVNPITVKLTGANINRRTLDNIRIAGFHIGEKRNLMGSIMRMLVLSPNK